MKKWLSSLLLLALVSTACATQAPQANSTGTTPPPSSTNAAGGDNQPGQASSSPLARYGDVIKKASAIPGAPKDELLKFSKMVDEAAKLLGREDSPFPEKYKSLKDLLSVYKSIKLPNECKAIIAPLESEMLTLEKDFDARYLEELQNHPDSLNQTKAQPQAQAQPQDPAQAQPQAKSASPAAGQQAPTAGGAVGKATKTTSGLLITITNPGRAGGKVAKPGSKAVVHYTGTLKNGKKFDSSRDRNEPFEFIIGQGSVIAGWDEGVNGMVVGEVRKLEIPPKLGYGDKKTGTIPANSVLNFEIELLDVQ